MSNGETPSSDKPIEVPNALLEYVALNHPVDREVLLAFAQDPKAILRSIGEGVAAIKGKQAHARYKRLCDFADRHTNYEAMGPEGSKGDNGGVAGGGRASRPRATLRSQGPND